MMSKGLGSLVLMGSHSQGARPQNLPSYKEMVQCIYINDQEKQSQRYQEKVHLWTTVKVKLILVCSIIFIKDYKLSFYFFGQ